MLTTVEAEIDVMGNVRLLEPLKLTKTSRAIVTVLEEKIEIGESHKANERRMLDFIKNNRLPNESRPSIEEIEAQIKENRESWD